MSWLIDNFALVARLTGNHVALSIVPIILGFVVAVPLGWIANRWVTLRQVVIAGEVFSTRSPRSRSS